VNYKCRFISVVIFAADAYLKGRNAAVKRKANDIMSMTKQETMTDNLSLRIHGHGISGVMKS
jgi:hypothetical protein